MNMTPPNSASRPRCPSGLRSILKSEVDVKTFSCPVAAADPRCRRFRDPDRRCAAIFSRTSRIGTAAQSRPDYLKNSGIDQNLNHQLPLADHFRDESGADVALGQYFSKRPVVLALVYFKCGMLCPQVLHGAAAALKQTGFHPGHQYRRSRRLHRSDR